MVVSIVANNTPESSTISPSMPWLSYLNSLVLNGVGIHFTAPVPREEDNDCYFRPRLYQVRFVRTQCRGVNGPPWRRLGKA